ncbi:MAG: hypothetical protein FWE59_04715, partial [Oscillospiraceae bacterium]|nr:hypothetical protein [Oscillospiraceae bacterium]
EMGTGEIELAFLAFNLRRVVNILGVKKLVDAIKNASLSSENSFASSKCSIISLFESFFSVAKLAWLKVAIIF